MATRSLGQLTLDLVARTGGWQRGMDASERRTQRWRRQVQSELRKAGTAFAGLATAAAAGLGAAVLQTTNSAREIEILARLADTSTQQFQRMAFGAERFGIGQEKLSGILKDTTDRVGDFIATGGGPMADFFENIAPKVGVTAEQFARLSGPEALQLYVNSLQEAGVSQAEMTFYMEALASDAAALVPLLANDGEEMRRLAEQAERTGNVFSELEFEQLKAIRDGMDELGAAATGMKNQVVLDALPAIEDLIDQLSDPQTLENAQALGNAIVTAMGWAVDAIDAVVGVTGFLSEELAAFMNGPGLHDIVRLEEQVERQEELVDRLMNGPNRPPQSILDEEIAKLEEYNALLEQGRQLQQSLAGMQPGGGGGDRDGNSGAVGGEDDGGFLNQVFGGLNERAVELMKEFADATENQTEELESAAAATSDFADTVSGSAAAIAQSIAAIDPRYNIKAGGDTASERARSRFEASAFHVGDPSVTNFGGSSFDLPGLSRLDRSAREASVESGGRNLGTLRLTNDRGDSVEVEGERDNLTKWLADTLSSAAASVD